MFSQFPRWTTRCSRSPPTTAPRRRLGLPQNVYQLDTSQDEGVQGRQGRAAQAAAAARRDHEAARRRGLDHLRRASRSGPASRSPTSPAAAGRSAGAVAAIVGPGRLAVHPAPPGVGAGGARAPTASPSSRWPASAAASPRSSPRNSATSPDALHERAPGAPDPTPAPTRTPDRPRRADRRRPRRPHLPKEPRQ